MHVNGYSVRFAVAAVLWTAVLSMALAGSIDSNAELRFWALMTAMPALLVTGHLIVQEAVRAERIRVEELVEGLVAAARERADSQLPRLR